MRYSKQLIGTKKDAKTYASVNATLLQKAGFIDQTMAGVYAYLPLGWRVLNKIEDIIREEMDLVGAEVLMPALVPTSLWEQTNRIETVDVLYAAVPANAASAAKNDARYVLNSTHEEVATPIARQFKRSYKDLPFAFYQIQTKFRNEERPKSGLLRGREFRMKDLYSFHASPEDLREYYDRVKDVYMRIFMRLGLGEDTVIARASGGDFTDGYSHEFDTFCETGEDEVFYDEQEDAYYNREVASADLIAQVEPRRVCEVGNIFPLNTKFSQAFEYLYTDKEGKPQPVYMASYGIGSSRVMGVLVEKFHDEKGMVWPPSVSPFTVYLAALAEADSVYDQLTRAGVDVLYDDRAEVSAGEKLADADLLGMPWRIIVSKKTGDRIEIKRRQEDQHAAVLVKVEEFIDMIQEHS